jgi:hypothetical protein
LLGFVKDEDVRAAACLPDIEDAGSDYEMDEGWDRITTDFA